MAHEITRGDGYDVDVQWMRDAHVSIGTIMPELNEVQDLLGLVNCDPNPWRGARGLYATLPDRASVNKLIRDLKRARDSAFGKDE